jgi:hypothetical protein
LLARTGYVKFAVDVLAVSKQRDAAQALVDMSSLEAAPLPLIRKSGMEPPPR